jgi:hypothetical protein
MKKKLTPEDKERMRRVDEEGRAARENMQRLIDESAVRRRDREERSSRSLWRRMIGARHAD